MKIRDHEIGKDGVYIIAEACSNHAGDLRYAKQLVQVAADAGANAVKFQRFRVANLDKDQYPPKLLDRLAKLELPDRWLPVIRDMAHELGLAMICTPFDRESIEVLVDFVDAWKVRHTDFENTDILVHLPDAPAFFSIPAHEWEGRPDPQTLYCPTSYPTQLENLHLPQFPSDTGLSDHTLSLMTGALAVARGAQVLEKHFMLAGKGNAYLQKIVDGQVSLTPQRFASYVINARNAEKAIRPRGEEE